MAIAPPTPRPPPPVIAPSVRLDRSSPMSLWAQLETDLLRRLENGEFADAFPTDLVLTETYHVSRHTVREAIRHLNKAGVLRRERGRHQRLTEQALN